MQEEKDRLWPVILAAVLMISACGGAMFVGAQNEPTIPEDCQLSYVITVTVGNLTVHGTEFVLRSGSEEQIETAWESDLFSNGSEPIMHTAFFGGSALLDKVEIVTQFGTKCVDRYISLFEGEGLAAGQPEVRVTYTGSGSSLTYREDVITPEYRAVFILTDVDFSGISSLDLEPSDEVPEMGTPDFATFQMLDGLHDSDHVQTGDLEYAVNVTNYAHYYISQEDVLAMVDGGGFRYDQERSIIGNGSLEFRATGDWFLRYVGPVGEGPHQFQMVISER